MRPIYFDRIPEFNGKEFHFRNDYYSLNDALTYTFGLIDGEFDAFLTAAWFRILVRQTRSGIGRFGSGYVVDVWGRRPHKGEDYVLGEGKPYSTNLDEEESREKLE